MQNEKKIFSPPLGGCGTTDPKLLPQIRLFTEDSPVWHSDGERIQAAIEKYLAAMERRSAAIPLRRGKHRPRIRALGDHPAILICPPADLPAVRETCDPSPYALVTLGPDGPSSDTEEPKPYTFRLHPENGRIPQEGLRALKAFFADLPEEIQAVIFSEEPPFPITSGIAAALCLALGLDDLPVWDSPDRRPDTRTFEALALSYGIRIDTSMRDHREKQNNRAVKKAKREK